MTTISIKQILESTGVSVTDELLNEFGEVDTSHPALAAAAKAKAEQEREAKPEEIPVQPKDYAEEEEDPDWDERTEPELDRQTNYDAPPRDDGDDSYDQDWGYEEEEEDWNYDYATDTGMSATCPKCGSDDVGNEMGRAMKDRVMASHLECADCGHKSSWSGPDAALAQKRYGNPNEAEQEEQSFDFSAAVKEARERIEKDKRETAQQAAVRRHGDRPIKKDEKKYFNALKK